MYTQKSRFNKTDIQDKSRSKKTKSTNKTRISKSKTQYQKKIDPKTKQDLKNKIQESDPKIEIQNSICKTRDKQKSKSKTNNIQK